MTYGVNRLSTCNSQKSHLVVQCSFSNTNTLDIMKKIYARLSKYLPLENCEFTPTGLSENSIFDWRSREIRRDRKIP